MRYSEDNLYNYTSYYELESFENENEQILNAINAALASIQQNSQVDCITNTEIFYIGSIVNYTNSNPKDTIDILVKINNPIVLDLNMKYTKIKRQKQKNKIFATPAIQYVIAYALLNAFTSVTSVYNRNSYIFVDSLSELGKNYRIFVTASSNKGNFVCHGINVARNTEFEYNIENAATNFVRKDEETQGAFSNMLRVVKNIAYDLNLTVDNNVVESLFYNIPNKYFTGNYNEMLIKLLNYLKLTDYTNFESIDGTGKIVKNGFYDTSVLVLKKFVDSLCFALQ